MGDKGKGVWLSKSVGTRRALASSGVVEEKSKGRYLAATAWPLRDMRPFRNDFINQALRS